MKESENRRQTRTVWVFGTVLLSLIAFILIFVPAVFSQSVDADTQRLLNTFEQVFLFVQKNYVDEQDPSELFEGALKGLFESLDDPHSAYLTADDMRTLTDTTSGEFGGVGLYISKPNPENESNIGKPGFVEVIAPIEGTPAFRAGVITGDMITHIEDESVEPLSIDDVVNKLRGRPGTTVTITLLRGGKLSFEVELDRAMIRVPTVRHAMIDDGTAFMRVIQFTPYTAEKVREALAEFEEEGYSSLIIDLRSNPGGLLKSVIDTADLFFSGGTIVSTRSRIERENELFEANMGKIVPDSIEIVVLVDGGSASAAEIMAGVMKDRNRATLIGETTYGKGSVQQIRRIGEGGFRLTMSRYYTPSGVTIDKVGIEPQIVVEGDDFSEEELVSYGQLIAENVIRDFVREDVEHSQGEIDRFVQDVLDRDELYKEDIIRRMVRNEINRRSTNPPVFDLEYDTVLQKALEVLRGQ